jgi:hypothetical protein
MSHKHVFLINNLICMIFYLSENGKPPVLVINLSTMCYHYKIRKAMFLIEHRLNKTKMRVESFFAELQKAGAELIFVYKRAKSDDKEFLEKNVHDFKSTQNLMQDLNTKTSVSEIKKYMRLSTLLPHNNFVLLVLIQSAKKFGKVHRVGSYDFKPAVAIGEFLAKNNASWILGLDTYHFVMDGNWKIWADDTLNLKKELSVTEIDKDAIMTHFGLSPEHLPLLATVLGDLESTEKRKVFNFFGTVSKINAAVKFVKSIPHPLTDESFARIGAKIFGSKCNESVIADFKNSINQFSVSKVCGSPKIDAELLALIQDDFLSHALPILTNDVPIFIAPDMVCTSLINIMDYNNLVLPWIQKTAGILLKNSNDKAEARKIIMLTGTNQKFITQDLEVTYPDFEVPTLKEILSGKTSAYLMTKMLFYIVGIKLEKFELPSLQYNTMVDCMILLFMIKMDLISVLESRCLLKAIIDTRENVFLTNDLKYPKIISGRAIHCSLLYMKLFFELHSCLGALGMRNYCPEFSVCSESLLLCIKLMIFFRSTTVSCF